MHELRHATKNSSCVSVRVLAPGLSDKVTVALPHSGPPNLRGLYSLAMCSGGGSKATLGLNFWP